MALEQMEPEDVPLLFVPTQLSPQNQGDSSGVFGGHCHDFAARAGGATSFPQILLQQELSTLSFLL